MKFLAFIAEGHSAMNLWFPTSLAGGDSWSFCLEDSIFSLCGGVSSPGCKVGVDPSCRLCTKTQETLTLQAN